MMFMAALALGVFLGNWLVQPFIVPGRTFEDSFWIGVIAAFIVMIFAITIEGYQHLR